MKLIWRTLHELKSSRFSTALIIIELIFSIVCYQLCFSLTADYLGLRSFFADNYDGNSVRVYFNDEDPKQLSTLTESISPEQSFTVRHYVSDRDDGIFISCFSDEAFKIAEEAGCTAVDLDADYNGAQPCLISRTIADKYPAGQEHAIAGRRYYVCGVLSNDTVFYMSSTGTGSAFIMASDRFKEPGADYVNGCIFMKVGTERMDAVTAQLENTEGIAGYERFDPDDALKKEFAAVSGILIIGVWIAVISTIGLLANNYLTYKKNERSYLVMITIGAKKRDITVLYLLRMLFCIAIALPLSFAASKLFAAWQGTQLAGGMSIAFAVGTAVVIELLSALMIAVGSGLHRS